MTESRNIRDSLFLLALLALAVVLQLPALFGGVEVADTGAYLTLYDNIFTHPDSVDYFFMYYGAGLAGGLLAKLCGGSLLWMRIFGLAVNLGSIMIVWKLFGRRHKLAMTIMVFIICTANLLFPLTFYQDPLTSFMATLSLALMITAVRRGASHLFLLSGLVAGLNALTRIPNLLEILFVLILPLSSGLRGHELRRACGVWLAGWVSGFGVLLLTALVLGHWPYLAQTFQTLLDTGASEGSDSKHSLFYLLVANLRIWVKVLYFIIKFGALALVFYVTRRVLISMGIRAGSMTMWLLLFIPVAYWLVFATRWLIRLDYQTSLYSIVILGDIIALLPWRKASRTLRLTALSGLFMIAILPAGSDGSISSAGPILLWLALPAAIVAMIPPRLAAQTKPLIIITASIIMYRICFQLKYDMLYFDSTPMTQMTATIDSPLARGLHTSRSRAERLNRILATVEREVEAGDTLLVYGAAPLVNHLTRTIPAIGCPWPELLTSAQLTERLKEHPEPQYILLLRFRSVGGQWSEPSESFAQGDYYGPEGDKIYNIMHNRQKSGIMLRYITDKGYEPVAQSPDIILYRRKRTIQ